MGRDQIFALGSKPKIWASGGPNDYTYWNLWDSVNYHFGFKSWHDALRALSQLMVVRVATRNRNPPIRFNP